MNIVYDLMVLTSSALINLKQLDVAKDFAECVIKNDSKH